MLKQYTLPRVINKIYANLQRRNHFNKSNNKEDLNYNNN